MHNHDGKNSSSMMWMMIICCLFPLIFLVPALGRWFSGRYLWLILIVGFVIAHLWMHRKHHSNKDDHASLESNPKSEHGEADEEDKSNQSHSGHCH